MFIVYDINIFWPASFVKFPWLGGIDEQNLANPGEN